jgi:hypothetical protein
MKTIIEVKIPVRIPYMENPPAKGGEIKYLTPEEFQKKFNCEYCEGVKVQDEKYGTIDPNQLNAPLEKAIYTRLINPLDYLVICKMDNDLGYGLFTLEDIKLGTVLCIYSGEYSLGNNESEYSLSQINATKTGGVARFMQHLPIIPYTYANFLCQSTRNSNLYSMLNDLGEAEAEKRIEDKDSIQNELRMVFHIAENCPERFDHYQIADLKTDIQKSVADSNIFYKIVKINGVELIAMIAMRDIKKNEIIGFSYGNSYWRNHSAIKQPVLFNKQGGIITKKENQLSDFAVKLSQSVGHRHKETEEIKHARLQELERLSAKLKEMERNHGSEEASNSSYNSDEEEYFSDEQVNSDPDNQLVKIINLMQKLPVLYSADTNLTPSTKKMERTPETASKNSPIKSNIEPQKTEEIEKKLQNKTLYFFGSQTNTQWKKYPETGLVGKYIGHQVRFFTMAATETAQAKAFAEQLQKTGFDVELKKAKDKPSVVVDLTTSMLTI